jgi:hypothetical protein
LNISNNRLTSLSLALPSDFRKPMPSDAFYAPTSRLLDRPFPSLQILLALGNKITCGTMGAVPLTLLKIDLSQNPLGDDGMNPFLLSLGNLAALKDVRLHDCDISNAILPIGPLPSTSFPKLEVLDLGGNDRLSEVWVRKALLPDQKVVLIQGVEADAGGSDSVRLSIGKVIKKEAWEIEVKRKSGLRNDHVESPGDEEGLFGLGFGSGSKAQQAPKVGSVTTKTNLHTSSSPEPSLVIQKEQWEIDAEAGLHTAAGRRRAEMAAAVAEEASVQARDTADMGTAAKTGASPDKYYNASHSSLILLSALPVTRRILTTHGRAMSVGTTGPSLVSDLLVPMQTLPLPLIESHPWSTTLWVLELSN